MLMLRSPMERRAERDYIYQVIFGEFLGMDVHVLYEARPDILIIAEAESESEDAPETARLRIADQLLAAGDSCWLKPESMPKLPLEEAVIPGFSTVPVLYGKPNARGTYLYDQGQEIECGIDLFGSTFFMLTRYEEIVNPARDQHDRFPAVSSTAYRAHFLDRPIVNEYVEILYSLLQHFWPKLRRKTRELHTRISHDVDSAYFIYGKSFLSVAKESAADVIRRFDTESGLKKAGMLRKGRDLASDPHNTFDWLMDLSEQHQIRSSFYFITEQTHAYMDGNYSMKDRNIRRLLQEIHERGHEIGLHPAYQTYVHPEKIRRQFEILRSTAEECGITQLQWGGRQHYLRWRAPDTWQHWEDAGLQYDSTLGYADLSGFRCGVCYEFPVFNLVTRKPLKLRERPLMVMDQSILHPNYMGLTGEKALHKIMYYYEQCVKYQGDFTLLWHNSQLVRSVDRQLYQSILEKISAYKRGEVTSS